MALEITGKIEELHDTVIVSDRFRKREFVLDITEIASNGQSYPNFAKFQAVQTRCDLLDVFKVGDMVKISFNVRGNKWEKDGKTNYITSLDAWRIERVGEASAPAAATAQPAAQQPSNGVAPNPAQTTGAADDLPF